MMPGIIFPLRNNSANLVVKTTFVTEQEHYIGFFEKI